MTTTPHPTAKFGVIIPAYNEPRLTLLLQRFNFQITPLVVVVNDGSTDDSCQAARSSPVTLLTHDHTRGIGAAIRTGLVHLRQENCDIAVVMAGNNKDNPAEIPQLLAALEQGADYVQGSRFADPTKSEGTPLLRRLLTRMVAFLWSLRFFRNLTDVTNGFRAYRLSLLDDPRIDITQPWLDRYELEYYLHYKVLSCGYKYAEVPVTKIYPQDGLPTSKIRLTRDLWSLLRPFILLTLRLRK